MTNSLSIQVIEAALVKIGVFPQLAGQAATDQRIPWTKETVQACVQWCKASTAKQPGAALWSQYLQHGTTPPALTVIPSPAPVVICPVCKHDPHAPQPDAPHGCQGLHGWAAAFRIDLQQQDGAA